MRAVDTNILVRVFERDDPSLTALAEDVLAGENEIFISTIVLCEFAWVLKSVYRRRAERMAEIVRRLLQIDGVTLDRAAAQAGLAFIEAGGDFSDGVVLHEANRAGCSDLATLDPQFARLGGPDVTLIS